MITLAAVKRYFIGSREMRFLLIVLVLLVFADGLITRFLVFNGIVTEGNPLLQGWVHDDNFLLLKLSGALFASLLLWDIYKRKPRLSIISTLCLVTFYLAVVYWNLAAPLIAYLSFY